MLPKRGGGVEKLARVISQRIARPKAIGSTPISYAREHSVPVRELITSVLASEKKEKGILSKESHVAALRRRC